MSGTERSEAPGYPLPWSVRSGMISHTVVDAYDRPICHLPPFDWSRPIDTERQARCAALLMLAPEMLRHLAQLVEIMRLADAETAMSQESPVCTDEQWDAALDEAQALIELLADEGLTAGVSP